MPLLGFSGFSDADIQSCGRFWLFLGGQRRFEGFGSDDRHGSFDLLGLELVFAEGSCFLPLDFPPDYYSPIRFFG